MGDPVGGMYHGVCHPWALGITAGARPIPPKGHMLQNENVTTYKVMNLVGLNARAGARRKAITKHTSAPKLQAPKMSIRSHLLTVVAIKGENVSLRHLSPWRPRKASRVKNPNFLI